MWHKELLALCGAVLFTGAALALGAVTAARSQTAATALAQASASSEQRIIVLAPELITAVAAVIYDPQTGEVLYQKNAAQQMPLASLTKLMTAQAALRTSPSPTHMTVRAEDLAPEGDSGLIPGTVASVHTLLALSLVASSNDAVTALARSMDDTVVRMNDEARRLSLTKTHFFNPTGLDVSEHTSGGYGSAYDMARLAAAFYSDHKDLFELTVRGPSGTAEPLFDIPGLAAAKTGYTDLAGGNLVAVFDLSVGYPLVVVALHSTREGRFEDVRALISAAREQL